MEKLMKTVKRILICDDEAEVRSVLQAMLDDSSSYEIVTAATGNIALQIAATEPVDLILLDLFMPQMGGWEVVAALRSSPETRSIPIVIVSLLSAKDIEVGARSVEGWVDKPVDEARLLSVVERVLSVPSVDPARILVIEDNDLTAGVLSALLERHVGSYHRARTGVEALEIASWLRPHLLVLDVLLPDIDGYSVIKWLRKHDALRSTPVIVYSGAEISTSDRARLELGKTEFLPKGEFPIRSVEQKALSILGDVFRGVRAASSGPVY
jgi:CheY-like chemotaxis protein